MLELILILKLLVLPAVKAYLLIT